MPHTVLAMMLTLSVPQPIQWQESNPARNPARKQDRVSQALMKSLKFIIIEITILFANKQNADNLIWILIYSDKLVPSIGYH